MDAEVGIGRRASVLAVITGLVALGSMVSLALFYVLGPPLGTINDAGNSLTGLLSAWLALELRESSRTGWPAIISAVVGAALTVIGSALVMSDTTGFLLAGLVSSVGFAFIGAWLLALNRSITSPRRWGSSHRTLGWVAAAAMLVGIVAAPGILMGIDDMGAVPPWLWTFGLGWLGIYLLYPIWCLRLGAVELRRH